MMRSAIAGGALALALMGPASSAGGKPAPAAPATTLQPVSAFAGIKDAKARSIALFREAGKVIQHPRCLNCHPRTDRPTQGDRMTPHEPLVVRGDGGLGATGMRCTTCHHEANYDAAGIPGHPRWHLAPIEQAWQGRTLGEICRQIKDPKRNGEMDMPALVKHMAEDDLVGWGWHPDKGRTPAPGTQAQFGAIFKAWADSGAYCPA